MSIPRLIYVSHNSNANTQINSFRDRKFHFITRTFSEIAHFWLPSIFKFYNVTTDSDFLYIIMHRCDRAWFSFLPVILVTAGRWMEVNILWTIILYVAIISLWIPLFTCSSNILLSIPKAKSCFLAFCSISVILSWRSMVGTIHHLSYVFSVIITSDNQTEFRISVKVKRLLGAVFNIPPENTTGCRF